MKTFFLLIFLLVTGLIIAGFGWYNRAGVKIVADTLISPYKPLIEKHVPSPKPSPPPKWENVNIPSYGLGLRLPPGWIVDKDAAVLRPTSGNMSIAISSNSGVLVPNIFNQDLFQKIYNLKTGDEFTHEYLDERIKFRNIESGKILTGQPYTVFVWDFNNIQTAARLVETRAFILKDTTLIIFTLNKPTDEGMEFLRKIVGFSSLN